MTASDDRGDALLAFEGTPGAPPRVNGELVFEAPWQTRAFGLAAELVEQGRFTWRDFQAQLIAVIARWEALPPGERRDWVYYERWLEALEELVITREVLDASAISGRATEYAARPHGHDH